MLLEAQRSMKGNSGDRIQNEKSTLLTTEF